MEIKWSIVEFRHSWTSLLKLFMRIIEHFLFISLKFRKLPILSIGGFSAWILVILNILIFLSPSTHKKNNNTNDNSTTDPNRKSQDQGQIFVISSRWKCNVCASETCRQDMQRTKWLNFSDCLADRHMHLVHCFLRWQFYLPFDDGRALINLENLNPNVIIFLLNLNVAW